MNCRGKIIPSRSDISRFSRGTPVAGPQFGHRVVAGISNPHVRPVECQSIRSGAYGECSQHDAVARPELGDVVVKALSVAGQAARC